MESIKSVYNLQCLVGGTEKGEIKVFPPIFTTSTWDPCPTHLGKVTAIKNSADGRFLFTCGEDGALCAALGPPFRAEQQRQGRVRLRHPLKGLTNA